MSERFLHRSVGVVEWNYLETHIEMMKWFSSDHCKELTSEQKEAVTKTVDSILEMMK